MENTAVFERKVALTSRDLNGITKSSLDDMILAKLQALLEKKCSQHGWVVPGSVKLLSRSMYQEEAGRFTGDMVSWVQVEAKVVYPTDGMIINGEVLKKNKMGLFVVYEVGGHGAIQVQVPRDLHLDDEGYDQVKIGDIVKVEIKRSRFQANDPYILSIGLLLGAGTVERMEEKALAPVPEEAEEVAPAAAAEAPEEEEEEEGVLDTLGDTITEVGSVAAAAIGLE